MGDSDIHTASLSDRFLRVFKKIDKKIFFFNFYFFLFEKMDFNG